MNLHRFLQSFIWEKFNCFRSFTYKGFEKRCEISMQSTSQKQRAKDLISKREKMYNEQCIELLLVYTTFG